MSERNVKKVVLAYSGGLDTSVIVPWLRENYGCEVVCFTADIGQGDELEGLEAKALASGASQLVVKDLKEEFAREHLFPVLRAGAVYERKYLLGTSMARPLIAKHQVEVAHQVGADAVAHGANRQGQRPGALRAHLRRPGPAPQGDLPLAGVGDPFAPGRHRLRPRPGDPHRGQREVDLQPRLQPVPPVSRRWASGRQIGRAHV